MRVTLFIALLLLPIMAVAEFTATGVGGGGWLHSGAILPGDSDVIVIGSDVAGVYRTDDFGSSWTPWNEGLYNSDDTRTHQVEDLIGVELDNWEGFYAATMGGIYRRDEGDNWECTTDPDDYSYKCGSDSAAIPFTCLDWDGDSLLVAGAGRTWPKGDYSESVEYEEGAYPACENGQYSVWTLDLTDTSASWEADTETEYGTARDISVAVIGGDTLIAVGTHDGIYLKESGDWSSIAGSLYEDDLTCWSLHLTERGTLYAAMERAGEGCTTGVYMLFDVTSDSVWSYVDDGAVIEPNGKSMKQIGALTWVHPIFLSVWEGHDSTPDILWLGCWSSKGLFRGIQEYHSDSLCHWQNKVYSHGDPPTCYYRDSNDTQQNLDPGWISMVGTAAGTHPILAPSDSTKLALQVTSRMHVSSTRGDSWTQAYTTETYSGSGFWYSKGYNELCVHDLAVMGDGRVLESTGDYGLFRSSDEDMDYWEHLATPGTAPNMETRSIQVLGSNIYVVAGNGYLGGHNALYKISSGDVWSLITTDLADPTHYKFSDFLFVDANTCFIAYRKYSGAVDTASTTIGFGVLKGTYDEMAPDPWTWTEWSNGLLAISSPCSSNAIGVDLLDHPSGRIFMAAAHSKILFPGQGDLVNVPGGIYKLDGPTDSTWELEIGGADSEWRDCRCLAQSTDGSVVYAGTRGSASSITGTVFKCSDPTSDPTTWTPLINTSTTGYHFGFESPHYVGWSEANANRWLTDVRALAVDTRDEDVIYVGLSRCATFPKQLGLWKYDPDAALRTWKRLSKNTVFTGVGVHALLTIADGNDCMLVVGTHGHELYYELQTDAGQIGGGLAPRPGLKLLSLRSLRGGRTEVRFSLTRASSVDMRIYDVRGRLLYHHDVGRHKEGECSLVWDGRNEHTKLCAPGIYFLQLEAGRDRVNRKFMVLR